MTLRSNLSIACNAFIAVMTAVAVFMTLTGWMNPAGMLMSHGIHNFKYFTVLSNVFSGVVSAAFAIALLRSRKTDAVPSEPLRILKLMATTAVTVTFLTVVVLFCIIFKLHGMFRGANLWYHLVLPLVAIVDYCLLCGRIAPSIPKSALSLLPVGVYGLAYYANILINGVGEWPHSNDWYGFLAWGMDAAPIVFAVMLLLTWVIALVLCALNRAFSRRS